MPGSQEARADVPHHEIRCICETSHNDGTLALIHCRHCGTLQHVSCYFKPGVPADHSTFEHVCAACRPDVPPSSVAMAIERLAVLRGGMPKHIDDGLRPPRSWVELITEIFSESNCLLLTGSEISAAIAAKYAFWRDELNSSGTESRLKSNVSSILAQNSSRSAISKGALFTPFRPAKLDSNKGAYWALSSSHVTANDLSTSNERQALLDETLTSSVSDKQKPDSTLGSGPSTLAYYVRHSRSSTFSVETRRPHTKPWAELSPVTHFEINSQSYSVGDVVVIQLENDNDAFALIKETRALENGLLAAVVWWFCPKEKILINAHTRKKRDAWPQDQTHLLSNQLEVIYTASISGKLGSEHLTWCSKMVDGDISRSAKVRDSTDKAVSWVCGLPEQPVQDSPGEPVKGPCSSSLLRLRKMKERIIQTALLDSVRADVVSKEGRNKDPRLTKHLYKNRQIDINEFDILPIHLFTRSKPVIISLLHKPTSRMVLIGYEMTNDELTVVLAKPLPRLPEQTMALDDISEEETIWLDSEEKETQRMIDCFGECKAFLVEEQESTKGRWWEVNGATASQQDIRDWQAMRIKPWRIY